MFFLCCKQIASLPLLSIQPLAAAISFSLAGSGASCILRIGFPPDAGIEVLEISMSSVTCPDIKHRHVWVHS